MGVVTEIIQEHFVTLAIAVFIVLILTRGSQKAKANEPPLVPYTIPFLGSAIEYGIDPIKFLKKCYDQYGDCFTFVMMGRRMTFCLQPQGNHFVFNVPLKNASAEGAYATLTVPVFGKEVVYDVENAVFMEQKKFVKDAFTVTAFKKYVGLIRQETIEFLKEMPKCSSVIFEQMSELTIRTASTCLMGKEIRQQLHSNVAQLYHDLDNGLAPINVFFKWLPTPTYYRRDKAHKIMTNTFKNIIKKRREQNDVANSDVLQTLMTSTYRDGSKMSDDAVAHMMIATLMGGQHTSSTTTSWILFELSRRPDVIKQILKEQSVVLTGKEDTPPSELPDFDYDQLRQMEYLDCVMKETLRLHPPIHTIMRKVEENLEYKGMTIPEGHFLCSAPAFSQLDPERFPEPQKFEPTRFINNDEGSGEWKLSDVNVTQKSARSHFLPFGAGRHRCIGEAFAYVQIKTIIATFLRQYQHLAVDKFPKMDYTSLIVVPERGAILKYH